MSSPVTSPTNASLSPAMLTLLNGTSSPASSSAGSSTTTAAGTPTAASLQNEFLTLFTTQLKNQDPLNPMDSSQMTSQLAQISTVTGIQQLDTSVQSLLNSNTAAETTQSASLIGHEVLGPGSSLTMNGTSGTTLGVSLQGPADTVTVNVLDSNGNAVKTFNLGAETNTVVPVSWDGTTNAGTMAPAGNYSLSTQATLSGKTVTATPLVQGKVTGVTNSSAGISLDVAGIGSVALGSVAQIN